MNLLRPPLLRAGSLDAARVPSRISGQLVQPATVHIGAEAAPAPTPAAPVPASPCTSVDGRDKALREARRLTRQHHITPAELADHAERAVAIAEARALIAAHGISRRDLFGR